MPKPNLRAVDRDVEHPRERAKREIKRFRTNAERERLPICNQDHSGAKNLAVDEVIRRTEKEMPEEIRPRYRPNPLIVLLMIVVPILIGLYWIITN